MFHNYLYNKTKVQKVTLFFYLLVILGSLLAFLPKQKVQWLKWKEIEQLQAKNQKPLLIDIYTDWCVYCKKMDKKIYSNPKVVDYINQHYYPIKLNAEQNELIRYKGKNYQFSNFYKVHEWVLYLTQGNVVYPTTVVIPINGDPYFLAGELDLQTMEKVLRFGAESTQNQSFENFMKDFKASW